MKWDDYEPEDVEFRIFCVLMAAMLGIVLAFPFLVWGC